MPNTSAHNPMSYLSNVSPILQACGNGDKQYDGKGNVDTTATGECTCTDPSYQYSNTCKIQSLNNHTGRTRCAFKTGGGDRINPSYGGPLQQVQGLTYNITPNGGGSTPFYKRTAAVSGITENVTKYPSSLLFCANPATGNASPNLPTNNITTDASGGLNATKWSKSNPNTGTSANIGFE